MDDDPKKTSGDPPSRPIAKSVLWWLIEFATFPIVVIAGIALTVVIGGLVHTVAVIGVATFFVGIAILIPAFGVLFALLWGLERLGWISEPDSDRWAYWVAVVVFATTAVVVSVLFISRSLGD